MLGDMSSYFNTVQRHGGQCLKFMFHTLREHNLSLIDEDLSVNQIKFKACADFVRSKSTKNVQVKPWLPLLR